MTYASGSIIAATDYNSIAFTNPSIGGQWGVGASRYGLGQSTSAISTATTASSVTAAQWTGLIQTINTCLSHQGQSAITPSSVTAGTLITYYAAIAAGSALAYTSSGTTGIALSDSAATSPTYSTAWGTTGNRGLKFTHTITFSSGDAARYFFNAGGKLKLSFSRSGGSATTRNTDWTALANACGSIQIGYQNTAKVGGSGTTSILLNATNGGYWAGTTSAVTHFKQFDASAGYTQDYIQVNLTESGTASNGGYPVITIETYWVNGHVQANQDAVDGTAITSMVVSSPSTTYLTNTWGTPTVGSSVALY